MGVSKTQIDRLGDRLKVGQIEKADLQLLDEYRRSFSDAHQMVINTIRDRLSLQPTGRPAKSTTAIVDKLRRESIRLSQIQDIAGCRLVVSDLTEQDDMVASLRAEIADLHVIDRRVNPSYGYRAVHVIVNSVGKAVEIQIRTMWQHKWAEFSEKCADAFGTDVKYGGGQELVRSLLLKMSETVANMEQLETNLRAKSHLRNEEVREVAREVQDVRNILLSCFAEGTAMAVEALEWRNKNDLPHRV